MVGLDVTDAYRSMPLGAGRLHPGRRAVAPDPPLHGAVTRHALGLQLRADLEGNHGERRVHVR